MALFHRLLYLSGSHHSHCGPCAPAETVMRKVITQYLLIIHLSSEHLGGHPVGGAHGGQRLLVLSLTAERGKRGRGEKEARC